ncbi:MAG: helix-turn-helix domain-containing protein [Acidobacteria bacterium]|nr:helix-turn-helix domain-containing protein [Acidobacteriota bacterium]
MRTDLTIPDEMPGKKRNGSNFGKRLVALRKAHGLTQVQLAEATRTTQRAISYYETQDSYRPAPVVAELARGLRVSTDELLGVKITTKTTRQVPPETRRLWKKFQQVMALPEKDRRAVIRLVNSLVTAKAPAKDRAPRRAIH